MKNRKRFLFLLIPVFIAAFLMPRFSVQTKFKQLEQETERIHDEAMKEMADMNRVARALKKMVVSADSLGISPAGRDSLANVLSQMNHAEQDMMAWMTGYKSPEYRFFPSKNDITYMNEQKTAIEKNQQDIHGALEIGRVFLKVTRTFQSGSH